MIVKIGWDGDQSGDDRLPGPWPSERRRISAEGSSTDAKDHPPSKGTWHCATPFPVWNSTEAFNEWLKRRTKSKKLRSTVLMFSANSSFLLWYSCWCWHWQSSWPCISERSSWRTLISTLFRPFFSFFSYFFFLIFLLFVHERNMRALSVDYCTHPCFLFFQQGSVSFLYTIKQSWPDTWTNWKK